MAKVTKDKVVEIHYRLRLPDGTVEDSTEGEAPLPYLHGASEILPGLEAALDGRETGEQFTVTLGPDQGYETLLEAIPFEDLPEDTELAEGDEIVITDEDGENEVVGTIEQITEDVVIVSSPHPLKGQSLTFDIEIVDVRDATPLELEHGHAHDPYSDEEDDEEWDEEDDEWEGDEEDEWDEEWDDEEDEWDDEEDENEDD